MKEMHFIKSLTAVILLITISSNLLLSQCLPSSPDTDNDGICNALDQCPNLDDQLIGTACDDGKACTTNDRWRASCDCEGTPLTDSDGDGVCDLEDQCPNFDDDMDIDNDGIPYCLDDCIDVNENGICDNIDNDPISKKLKVYFSLKRGFYDNSIQVSLIPNRPNTSIRYTIGTDPDCPSSNSGSTYSGPIQISNQNELQTLKVIGTNGNESTKVYTHTYLFNGYDLPTVVFSCSPYSEASGESETPISFEFIVPNDSPLKSVQEYAGTKTSKGGVKAGNSDKVYFRSDYGAGTLKEDLFSDFYYGVKPVNQFDQLFLRADHQDQTRLHQMISHDALRATEQLSPAGRYVYFYEFGDLDDVRHLQERPEAGFMEAWTGFDKPNFEAYSGDQHSNLVSSVSNASWSTVKRLVNIESLGNFLLSQWIGDAWDFWDNRNYRSAGPTSLSAANGAGLSWHYFNWDLDLGFARSSSWASSAFQSPEDILDRIEDNIEFRLQFTDIIHCALYNNGPLTSGVYVDRIEERHDELREFILPNNSFGVTNGVNSLRSYIPSKVSWLRNQLSSNNYYSDLRAVNYSLDEGSVASGQQLVLSNPNGSGSIYYTLDGTDVRTESGTLRSEAIQYTGPITLNPGVNDVFARVYRSSASSMVDRWSPSCGYKSYYTDQDYSNIVINEIHYSPLGLIQGQDTIGGKNFEFIELKNIGSTPVDLKRARFSKGVELTIENSLVVPPNGFVVFAEDPVQFQATYGFAPDGVYSGKLDNNGEKINLKDPLGYFIDQLEYNQKNPWDEAVDSTGYSLELLHSTLNNDDPLNWFRSDNIGGTPGAENSRTCAQAGAGIVINEINYNSNADQVDPGDWIELHNPTTTAIDLSGWTLYDNGDEFVIPQGKVLAAEGYLVIVDNFADFTSAFPNINSSKITGEIPFKLSSKGERISLFDHNKCLADYVIYNDKAPWPVAPDGDGPSLSLLDPALDNALPGSWESSLIMNASFVNGSPSVSNVCVPGQSCDDGNECTSNDIFDIDCNCAGTLELADSDNDGVCDLADICPNFNDSLIGTPCDDNNACTAGETYDINCGCTGGVQGDIDNDGLCDALDECNNNLTGTTCEDGDPCTTGETYDIDCNCTGGVPLDTDNDGVCDEVDVCEDFDDTLLGKICDDGNPLTEFDMYNATACGCEGIITDAEVCTKIIDADDDAEESLSGLFSTGSVDLSSSDLDMTNSYIVGLRFQNINIPNGASITNATIQFGSDETDSGATTITIHAEATDDAPPFTTANESISSKTKTAAMVTWQPAPWTSTGTAGPAQQTVDLVPIIQEIINRPGFSAGNAISIILESTGSRVAESYDTDPDIAAELCISYSTGACQPGYPCDDGNPITDNDILLADCSCAGSIIDADDDGVLVDEDCDDNDPTIPAPAGTTCDDDDASTENDVILADECSCEGTPCPTIGTACDDGDPSTTNDIEDGTCGCAGSPCPVAGTSCDDEDPSTTNDLEDGNCGCVGTPCPTAGTVCDDGDQSTTNDLENGNCTCIGTPCPSAGTACDDGDDCTTGETNDGNCNCTGGTLLDSDNDGICNLFDPCDLIDLEDFETDAGMWYADANGTDAFRTLSSDSPSGNYSFLIRDNSLLGSSVFSSVMDFTGLGSAEISFSFKSKSLSAGEDFFLELSIDGGTSFQVFRQWVNGTDFENETVYNEVVEILAEDLSSTVVFKFRSNGGINSDQIFLDDIKIESCSPLPDCKPSVVQSGNSIITQSEYVQNSITTNGRIMSGSDIKFSAGNEINLTANFEVKLGAVFHAYIDSCQD